MNLFRRTRTEKQQVLNVLRHSQVLRLVELLDETVLSRESFDVEEKLGKLVIAHKDIPQFSFAVWRGASGAYPFNMQAAPGSESAKELLTNRSNFKEITDLFIEWRNRVVEDVFAQTALEGSESAYAFRKQLNDQILKLSQPNAAFTEEGAAEWAAKVDATIDHLRQLRQDLNVTSEDLERLKREIEGLKALIRSMPKAAWVRAAGGKVAEFLERAAASTISAATEGAVKALLGPS